MSLLLGEMTEHGSQVEARDGIDCVLHTNPNADVTVPGDARTYCTRTLAQLLPPVPTHPESLREQIHSTLRPGVRAMVGNAGCEISFAYFRRVTTRPRRHVDAMLRWAEAAYELVGSQLILAPFNYDLVHEVMDGSRFLAWSAQNHVPLILFCGYSFLFPDDAFEAVRLRWKSWPYPCPYKYPYREVSEAIKKRGAEVWTGAGFQEGLKSGVLEKAEEFGFSMVLTTREAWSQWDGEYGN